MLWGVDEFFCLQLVNPRSHFKSNYLIQCHILNYFEICSICTINNNNNNKQPTILFCQIYIRINSLKTINLISQKSYKKQLCKKNKQAEQISKKN